MSKYPQNAKRFRWGPSVATLNPDKAKLLKDFAAGKVLDVGCGSGIYTNFLRTNGFEATGVDREKRFVRQIKKLYPYIRFINADAYNLPFDNNSFDTVIMFDILEHLDDKKALKEALRVGKRVIVSVPAKNEEILALYGLSHAHYLDRTHRRVYSETLLKIFFCQLGLKIIYLAPALPLSISSLLVDRLASGRPVKKILLKILLKPFLPEPPLYSTIFAVVERKR